MGKPGAFYLMNDFSVYLDRQRGGEEYLTKGTSLRPGFLIVSVQAQKFKTFMKQKIQDLKKNIKNVKGCRDGMPKSMQTR